MEAGPPGRALAAVGATKPSVVDVVRPTSQSAAGEASAGRNGSKCPKFAVAVGVPPNEYEVAGLYRLNCHRLPVVPPVAAEFSVLVTGMCTNLPLVNVQVTVAPGATVMPLMTALTTFPGPAAVVPLVVLSVPPLSQLALTKAHSPSLGSASLTL